MSYYFFILVETKDEASKQTLFDVIRWSRSPRYTSFYKVIIEKLLGPVFPIGMHTQGCHDECTMENNTLDWTNSFFNSFSQWLVSWLLDHLWTSNNVYFKASTFVSTNMQNNFKLILRTFSKIRFSDCIVFFVTVCVFTLVKTTCSEDNRGHVHLFMWCNGDHFLEMYPQCFSSYLAPHEYFNGIFHTIIISL